MLINSYAYALGNNNNNNNNNNNVYLFSATLILFRTYALSA